MKKITLLFSLFAITLVSAQGFSENFNASTNLPTGWTTTAQTGTDVWHVGDYAFEADFSSNVAYFDDDAAGPSGINKASLISPIINLASIANPKLSFDYMNAVYDYDTTITVEGYNGTSWVVLFSHTGDEYDFDNNGYLLLTTVNNISLSQFTNADFKIRFVYDDAGDYSFGCAVDNISITSSLATSEVSLAEVWKVYPVPTKDYLNIDKPNNIKNFTLIVTDMSGKDVKHFTETQSKYDLSELLPGKYFVTINDGKNKIQKKIVKR